MQRTLATVPIPATPRLARRPLGAALPTRRGAGACTLRPGFRVQCSAQQHGRVPAQREAVTSHRTAEEQHETSAAPASTGSAAAAAAAAALLLPMLQPGAAEAASVLASDQAYWTCVGLGSASVITTLLCTSRFLLSYFPELEKLARSKSPKRPTAVVLRALTAADPVLDPITRGFFKMTESGDLNYGAMALLALTSALLTTLMGEGGLMVGHVPDLDMLRALRYLLYFQHMLLLPMWVFVVFRWFLLI